MPASPRELPEVVTTPGQEDGGLGLEAGREEEAGEEMEEEAEDENEVDSSDDGDRDNVEEGGNGGAAEGLAPGTSGVGEMMDDDANEDGAQAPTSGDAAGSLIALGGEGEGEGEGDGDGEGEGEEAEAAGSAAAEREEVYVAGEVQRQEAELAVAALGSLSLLACGDDAGRWQGHVSVDARDCRPCEPPAFAFGRQCQLLPEVQRLLQAVGSRALWHAPMAGAATRIEWRAWFLRDRSLALLMGLHPRLGQDSALRRLDDNSVSLILREACTLEIAAACLAGLIGV